MKMDVLSQITELISLKGVVYTRRQFSGPWGIDVPAGNLAMFRLIAKGACLLKRKGGKAILLKAGDMVFLPHGDAHWMADRADTPRIAGEAFSAAMDAGKKIFRGKGAAFNIISGHFEFDRSSNHPFIKALPPLIHIANPAREKLEWLTHTSDLLIAEAGSGNMGSDMIVGRLSEVLFVQTIRAYLMQQNGENNFLLALADEGINAALHAMHTSPEIAWTLEALARKAGVSRTLFASRFRQLVGATPMEYLTKWRMLKAKELLINHNNTLAGVAMEVGYTSDAAFNRVFKRYIGSTPAAWRRANKKSGATAVS